MNLKEYTKINSFIIFSHYFPSNFPKTRHIRCTKLYPPPGHILVFIYRK